MKFEPKYLWRRNAWNTVAIPLVFPDFLEFPPLPNKLSDRSLSVRGVKPVDDRKRKVNEGTANNVRGISRSELETERRID